MSREESTVDEYVKNLLVKSLESERRWLEDAEEEFDRAEKRLDLARLSLESQRASVAALEAALKETGDE